MDPIKLRLMASDVNDRHINADGGIERMVTLVGVSRDPNPRPTILDFTDEELKARSIDPKTVAAALAEFEAKQALPNLNAVLGIPGNPPVRLTFTVRTPELVALFLRDRTFTLTLDPEAPPAELKTDGDVSAS